MSAKEGRCKRAVFFGLLAVFGVGVVFFFLAWSWRLVPLSTCQTHQDTYEVKLYTLNSATYRLLVVDTLEKQKYGLMNITDRSQICNADGMIFYFDKKRILSFWNMNTLVNLDVFWLDGDRVVGKTLLPKLSDASKPTTIFSPEPVDRVVEIIR
jgi:uncharacterized membrane protein (UPF0127 family)